MRIELAINAKKDLDAWRLKNKRSAADIVAVLKQMNADPSLQDKLLDRNSKDQGLSIRRWEEQYSKNNNLYRIKTITPEGYSNANWRIIYAFFPPSQFVIEQEIYVMAIVHRDEFNYEADHIITQRIHDDIRTYRY